MSKPKQVKSGYRVKQEAGLVPTRYDRDSRRFNEGAWRHWPENRLSSLAKGMERLDRDILKHGREQRGCIS